MDGGITVCGLLPALASGCGFPHHGAIEPDRQHEPAGAGEREVKRRADVIGIFPNDEPSIRLVGALMLETNDEGAVARR